LGSGNVKADEKEGGFVEAGVEEDWKV